MEESTQKEERSSDRLQMVIAILLAVTALLAAYATWMNQLHSSNMSANYAAANRINTEAVSLANAETVMLTTDMSLWYEAYSLSIQVEHYKESGDTAGAELTTMQMEALLDAFTPEFKKACLDALEKGEGASPFTDEFVESYFAESTERYDLAAETRAQGNMDNLHSDSFGLAQVFYSVVLFLLGLAGAWKDRRSKMFMVTASGIMLVLGFLYMISLPLPTDFSFANYWSHMFS